MIFERLQIETKKYQKVYVQNLKKIFRN